MIANLLILRLYIANLDLGIARVEHSSVKSGYILVQQSFAIMICQVINNSIMDLKYMIPQTFISLVIINYGIIVRLNKENQPLSELGQQNLISIINGFILGFLSLVLIGYLVSFFKYEVMRTLIQKIQVQEEFKLILQRLDEAIITISDNQINYSNNLGNTVLKNAFSQNTNFDKFINNINN